MDGLMPIGWIVLTAVFLYNLTVRTGQFEIIKDSIAAISDDRRLQALLIAFAFGSFLEGAACSGAGQRAGRIAKRSIVHQRKPEVSQHE